MRLGVSYIVFDGIELLEKSIDQIRQHVDYINVVYQNFSWFGAPIDSGDLSVLHELFNRKKINELILFDNFSPISNASQSSIKVAKKYETQKRQLGLNFCKRRNCTHFLGMDVDEFYESDKFLNAKNLILRSDYSSTAAHFINYVNLPTLHRGLDSIQVPFICKISKESKLGSGFFTKCDPTRGLSGDFRKSHLFDPNTIVMHHMETVRKNLTRKYESTTRLIFNRERTSKLVEIIERVGPETDSFDFDGIIFPKSGRGKLNKSENIFNITL